MSIYVNLNDEETKDLEEMARAERRTPGQQAAYLVVQSIQQRKAFEDLQRRSREMRELLGDKPSGHEFDHAQQMQSGYATRIGVGPIHGEKMESPEAVIRRSRGYSGPIEEADGVEHIGAHIREE